MKKNVPIGWTPRRYPVKKTEIDEDGDVVWYIYDGKNYTPHTREIILDWDREYCKAVRTCYSIRELRRGNSKNYYTMVKSFSRISGGTYDE